MLGLMESSALATGLLLLVVNSIYDQVAAARVGCMPSVKSMLCTQPSYKRLSDYLNKETGGSTELKENIRAAEKLVNDDDYCDGCSEYDQLVMAFAALRETPEEGLCKRPAMKGLRHLAETMRRESKASPKHTPEAVRRLNQMIVKIIKHARSVCPRILPGQISCEHSVEVCWPEAIDKKLHPTTPLRLSQLDRLARTFIFEDYQDVHTDASDQKIANDLKNIIAVNQLLESLHYQAHVTVVQADQDLDWSKKSLTRYIQEYIREPCDEFMRLPESKSILEPYVDLVISSFIITHPQEAKEGFYDDLYADQRGMHKSILDVTFRLGACSKLKAMDDEHLIKLIKSSNREALKKNKG